MVIMDYDKDDGSTESIRIESDGDNVRICVIGSPLYGDDMGCSICIPINDFLMLLKRSGIKECLVL